MGYELKMYVGVAHDMRDTEGDWFEVIGMVDLCKLGYNWETEKLAQMHTGKQGWMFGSDGSTKIYKDNYDATLQMYDAEIVLDALKADAKNHNYRRLPLAISLLESTLPQFTGHEQLKVILFGH